jgi:hypothetical protein
MRTLPGRALIGSMALLALAAAACGGGVSGRSVERVEPAVEGGGGDGVPPVNIGRKTLFVSKNTDPMELQPGSADLVQAVTGLGLEDEGLLVAAIRTTADSSGVFLVEDAPAVAWGTLLGRSQPEVFETYQKDPTLGDWLILVTDVVVHRLFDPIPPTAYRWTREAVDAYAECGMPRDTTDPCRQTFYRAATTVVLQAPGGAPRGR